MKQEKQDASNTLSLDGPKSLCLSETDPEVYGVISWAINMVPNPTLENIYKMCVSADEMSHLKPLEIRAAIGKALEEKKATIK
ncbi:MAG: hypothetical protein ACK4NR_12085 [Micavibrio sp.]